MMYIYLQSAKIIPNKRKKEEWCEKLSVTIFWTRWIAAVTRVTATRVTSSIIQITEGNGVITLNSFGFMSGSGQNMCNPKS